MTFDSRNTLLFLGALVFLSTAFAQNDREPAFAREWNVNVGAGALVGFGPNTIGLGLCAYTPLSATSSFHLGLDTGAFVRTDPTGVLIPAMAMILVQDRTAPVAPYFGMAAGGAFLLGGESWIEGAWFAKPGITFRAKDGSSLFFEPRFGMIERTFTFFPQFGVVLSYR